MEAPDLQQHLASLRGDVMNKPPEQHIAVQVAELFEALLAEAKRLKPDNAVVSAIRPFDRSQFGQVIGTYADLSVLTGQLFEVFHAASSGGSWTD